MGLALETFRRYQQLLSVGDYAQLPEVVDENAPVLAEARWSHLGGARIKDAEQQACPA